MRPVLLSVVAGLGAVTFAGSAPGSVPAATRAVPQAKVASVAASSGKFVPARLPDGYKVISRDSGARWEGGGTFESTTYGTATKREVLERRLKGLGAIFTVTVFRDGKTVTTPAGAAPRTVRGNAAWTVDNGGATILGWTEREGVSVQVIGQHGFSAAQLADIAANLVEQP